MKMSYWKKALSIGLAAVMTASMLAGCGGSGGTAKETAASGGDTAGTQFAGRMHGLLISWKADL